MSSSDHPSQKPLQTPQLDIDSFVSLAEKAYVDMGPTSLVQLLSEPNLLASFEPQYDDFNVLNPVPLTPARVKQFSQAFQQSHASDLVKAEMQKAEETVLFTLSQKSPQLF